MYLFSFVCGKISVGGFMKNRSSLREKCMTILYQIEVYSKNDINFDVEKVIKNVIDIDNEYVKEIVYGVLTYKNEIDEVVNKYMSDWTIDRLGNTDIAIMRIGVFELLYTDTPSIVAINEAVELSKKYSDDSVRKMINGVLDKIYHSKENIDE